MTDGGAAAALPPEFFRTERLIFRPFEPEDAHALFDISSDPLVCRYVGDGQPLDRPMVELWITRSRANVAAFGYGTGAIVDRQSGEMIGWGGVARPEGLPEEIVYGFAASQWGRGLGTEFVRGLIGFAFDTLGLPMLRATVYIENAASIAILRRLGFVREFRTAEMDAKSCLFVLHRVT